MQHLLARISFGIFYGSVLFSFGWLSGTGSQMESFPCVIYLGVPLLVRHGCAAAGGETRWKHGISGMNL
jgi:hypothetical protein